MKVLATINASFTFRTEELPANLRHRRNAAQIAELPIVDNRRQFVVILPANRATSYKLPGPSP